MRTRNGLWLQNKGSCSGCSGFLCEGGGLVRALQPVMGVTCLCAQLQRSVGDTLSESVIVNEAESAWQETRDVPEASFL